MYEKNTQSPRKNNIIWMIFAVAIVVICGYLFLTDDLEHIEDTNGADNYTLTTITDESIIKPDMFASVELHDLNGSFSLVIAGESTDFEFSLDSLFCEEYGIEIGDLH